MRQEGFDSDVARAKGKPPCGGRKAAPPPDALQNGGPDFFEPGLMEYLDKSEGLFDESTGLLLLRFEARGTRYEGRTEQIEKVAVGDAIQVVRDRENPFNPNNFTLLTAKGKNVGNMPAELCNAIAPLYDDGYLEFKESFAGYVEPISKRNRHAKQAVMFVELTLVITV